MRSRPKILAAILLLASHYMAGQVEQQTHRITLQDAIQKGLQANLRVLIASTRIEETRGTAERRFASLLPRVRAESFASLQNRNLRAFGISAPGIPDVIGPFSNFDFRVYADQAVLDLQSYRNWKASQRLEESSRKDYQDARDFIVRQVGGLYLNAESAAAQVEAAQARVTTADALYKIARDRHDAGVATGVDVLRAQVQLANEKQRLLEAQTSAKQALIALARNIGMSPGTPLELGEVLTFVPLERPEVNAMLQSALEQRPDYLSLTSQHLALAQQEQANRARYFPKFSVGGNYGGLGRSVGDIKGTGVLQGTLSITLFDRDRKGEEMELGARLKRIDDQMDDLRLGIEQEVREALLNLDSAAEEVKVAQEGRDLAQQELDLARDRFQAGVTNNIEVTSAQDSLARAQENYIVAVSRHVDAKLSLARAAGDTEQNYRQYVGEK
jgi:outer membrane protein TolC